MPANAKPDAFGSQLANFCCEHREEGQRRWLPMTVSGMGVPEQKEGKQNKLTWISSSSKTA